MSLICVDIKTPASSAIALRVIVTLDTGARHPFLYAWLRHSTLESTIALRVVATLDTVTAVSDLSLWSAQSSLGTAVAALSTAGAQHGTLCRCFTRHCRSARRCRCRLPSLHTTLPLLSSALPPLRTALPSLRTALLLYRSTLPSLCTVLSLLG